MTKACCVRDDILTTSHGHAVDCIISRVMAELVISRSYGTLYCHQWLIIRQCDTKVNLSLPSQPITILV